MIISKKTCPSCRTAFTGYSLNHDLKSSALNAIEIAKWIADDKEIARQAASGEFFIWIWDMSNRIYKVYIKKTDTIAKLKEKICTLLGLNVKRIWLKYKNKMILDSDDSKTLSSLGM